MIDNSEKDYLYEYMNLNNNSLHTLHENLTDNYIALLNINNNTNNIVLIESSVDKIIQYIEQVSSNATAVWNKFKNDATNSNIEKIINRNNMIYFQSRFRMRLPAKYLIPNLLQWYNIRDNCNIQDISDTNYNQMKQYLDSTTVFLNRFYNDFLDKDTSKNLKSSLNKKVFTYATGKEIVDSKIILQYVNFLSNYDDQVNIIGNDIDKINRTNINIKKMLTSLPKTEAYDFIINTYEYLNEAEGIPQKVKTISLMKKVDTNKITQPDPTKPKPKSDSTYIKNYYRVTMQVLSAKMNICHRIKNQSLKMCNQFIKLQPKSTTTGRPINPDNIRSVTIKK